MQMSAIVGFLKRMSQFDILLLTDSSFILTSVILTERPSLSQDHPQDTTQSAVLFGPLGSSCL